ncbi:flagellar biosynthetic protein FliO [Arenibaculum sp.]|jgi:flagellar protein FliO/FliZ|uniref:flagellar biosynthetic protein FliO n=1 Tax=Arenibaculum sp. TaxID=2865862 RepID=UPI002E1338AB|nr:flagellar biosynthetic protein FliO [Arenibaculum sp.]
MDYSTYIQFALALAFVLGLIALLALLLRRLGFGGPALSRGRQRRLSVVEVAAVDAKRRLVLVRRDDTEHLILLGPGDDTVVERGIPARPAFRDAVDAAEPERERAR